MARIFVVEDDAALRGELMRLLELQGHVALASTAFDRIADEALAADPDCVLLDLKLPGDGGHAVCRDLRRASDVPIVMLTSSDNEFDEVMSMNLGADDYVTKPFGTSELLARIRTALRHTRTAATSISLATSGRFKAGGLEIDYDKRRVFVDGESVHLTQNEYRIVSMLGLYSGRVLTYDYMLRELWGLSTKENRQILRVNMANIRRKLEKNPAEPQYIFTEIGVGYWMREAD